MRNVLRIAIKNGVRSLILGSMGFGPPSRSALLRCKDKEGHQGCAFECWREVLSENEFTGQGLWNDIWITVPDRWSDKYF